MHGLVRDGLILTGVRILTFLHLETSNKNGNIICVDLFFYSISSVFRVNQLSENLCQLHALPTVCLVSSTHIREAHNLM